MDDTIKGDHWKLTYYTSFQQENVWESVDRIENIKWRS